MGNFDFEFEFVDLQFDEMLHFHEKYPQSKHDMIYSKCALCLPITECRNAYIYNRLCNTS